jgi:hypothetical protein
MKEKYTGQITHGMVIARQKPINQMQTATHGTAMRAQKEKCTIQITHGIAMGRKKKNTITKKGRHAGLPLRRGAPACVPCIVIYRFERREKFNPAGHRP